MYAYIGSRTTRERNARGDGITVCRFDPQAGTLVPLQVLGDLVNPSYLTLNRAGNRLYCLHGDGHEVSAFRVDPADGTLALLDRQPCGGINPVHLALDPSERFLVVANHISGTLAVLEVAADGRLGAVRQLLELQGPVGPHRIEQPFAKPHFNLFDATGRFVLVPDKGLDRIFTFRFEDGLLSPATQPFVATRQGAGPRHVALHPQARFAYVVNELDSTVTTYRFDACSGALQALQILPSLPSTYTGDSRAAGIEVDRAGRFVYVSNRGDDSIAVFAIDGQSGVLSLVESQATGGRTPRFFTLTPDQRFLFALNEDSDSIVAMAVDPQCGRLSPTGFALSIGSPVCLVFSG
ncbi:lactonase family protein [Pseudomonas sp. NPDC089554]|uniref:lactonase family protein n=1 Tax=Pseudomonas sp. NPDC089554 TaxID=3390653 RepID=UPI003CFF99C6